MPEVIGIDHIYIAVTDLDRAEAFYDRVMPVLGFIICFFIWIHLSMLAMVVGSIWMIAGIAYGAWKTKGFQSDLVNFDVPSDETK